MNLPPRSSTHFRRTANRSIPSHRKADYTLYENNVLP